MTWNQNTHAGHQGIYVKIHSSAPPPASEYEAWLSDILSGERRARLKIDGAKLRRMVVMARQGATQKECGAAVGLSQKRAGEWLKKLPKGLSA